MFPSPLSHAAHNQVTGDGNKFANTYSRHQFVDRPDHNQAKPDDLECRRIAHGGQTGLQNGTCTAKAILRHILYMKTCSGYDRTFPDCICIWLGQDRHAAAVQEERNECVECGLSGENRE